MLDVMRFMREVCGCVSNRSSPTLPSSSSHRPLCYGNIVSDANRLRKWILLLTIVHPDDRIKVRHEWHLQSIGRRLNSINKMHWNCVQRINNGIDNLCRNHQTHASDSNVNNANARSVGGWRRTYVASNDVCASAMCMYSGSSNKEWMRRDTRYTITWRGCEFNSKYKIKCADFPFFAAEK